MHWRHRLMRRPHLHEPDAAHELTFSCHRRFAFLRAERTCAWLADAIDKARYEHPFLLWAYVFMPEHVHLLIWPTQPGSGVPDPGHRHRRPWRRSTQHRFLNVRPLWLRCSGWFLSCHTFTRYVKVTFFRGTSLRPTPPGGTVRSKDARWIDIHEGEELDEAQMATWVKQAAALPGWVP
jgi:REP element-mobilizing transposase RayT